MYYEKDSSLLPPRVWPQSTPEPSPSARPRVNSSPELVPVQFSPGEHGLAACEAQQTAAVIWEALGRAVLPRKWGTSHAPPLAALPSCAHRMSHMPMDHLEGLELSEVILHRAVAPAWLMALPFGPATCANRAACDLPLPMAMYGHATHGHWADMVHICYRHDVTSMGGTHRP